MIGAELRAAFEIVGGAVIEEEEVLHGRHIAAFGMKEKRADANSLI